MLKHFKFEWNLRREIYSNLRGVYFGENYSKLDAVKVNKNFFRRLDTKHQKTYDSALVLYIKGWFLDTKCDSYIQELNITVRVHNIQ